MDLESINDPKNHHRLVANKPSNYRLVQRAMEVDSPMVIKSYGLPTLQGWYEHITTSRGIVVQIDGEWRDIETVRLP